jgi:hypothetical protein
MPDQDQPPQQGTSAAGSGRAALDTALAYYRAWTGHDFEKAMTYIAEDIVCQAPAGRLDGAAAFRGFMGPFVQIVIRSSLIAAFGDDDKAVVMYDTDTVPVKDAPGAECVTVRHGKITHMRIIFDRLSFELARRAAGTAEPAGRPRRESPVCRLRGRLPAAGRAPGTCPLAPDRPTSTDHPLRRTLDRGLNGPISAPSGGSGAPVVRVWTCCGGSPGRRPPPGPRLFTGDE